MKINRYSFTNILIKNELDYNISLIFFDKNRLHEVLVFTKFSFYMINYVADMNFEGFNPFVPLEEYSSGATLYIEAIRATDINDVIYIKISNGHLFVLTHIIDTYSGDSYQYLKLITDENTDNLPPLDMTIYEKFNKDFESENFCDVLDLCFRGNLSD